MARPVKKVKATSDSKAHPNLYSTNLAELPTNQRRATSVVSSGTASQDDQDWASGTTGDSDDFGEISGSDQEGFRSTDRKYDHVSAWYNLTQDYTGMDGGYISSESNQNLTTYESDGSEDVPSNFPETLDTDEYESPRRKQRQVSPSELDEIYRKLVLEAHMASTPSKFQLAES